MAFPQKIKIVEVSARDGLQNEEKIVPSAIKIDFINQLSATGLQAIETTSFVSPRWVPQLADHAEVFAAVTKKKGTTYPVLVPNKKGMEAAIAVGVEEIAVFTTPSELFAQHNTHCTVAESLQRIAEVIQIAKHHHVRVRGYLSCVLGCPYQGEIPPTAVAGLAQKLIAMGCYEISLGDTIGVGTAAKTQQLLETVKQQVPVEQLAVHFHDTYGQALVNIYVALQQGVPTIDSSVSGLGGCPYAKGASGNVATEDVLYLLNGLGLETGVDMEKLLAAGEFITQYLQIETHSKVAKALRP